MVNIEFTRIWEDDYFFELECKAYSNNISLKMNAYVDDKTIDELSNKIKQFINLKTKDFVWETSKNGNDTTPNFIMKVFYRDNVGHLRIEIYGEIDDGASYDEHNCCFFIDGIEAGQLERFGKRILYLKNQGTGMKISII